MRYAISFVVLPVIISIGSCVPFTYIVAFNHTGKDLTVTADEKSYALSANSSAEILYPGFTREIKLASQDKAVWVYKIEVLPQEHMKGRWFSQYIFCQIEPDGRIYLVKPNTQMPIQALPIQPAGYPLIPLLKPG